VPLVVSVWGNDFTLHGPSTPLMRALTRRVLARADALHADCHRDIRLAHDWGLARDKPTLVTPCGGGVRLDVFRRATTTAPVVINPRGFRGYVRNDAFFRAIPLVRARRPDARFLCVAMAGEGQAVEWARSLGVSDAVDLLPHLRPEEMAAAFRSAQVLVSPTVHDGTPNSLLEGMASGCFPVAGDLESIREWITPGVNGALVDPGSPEQLADAIVAALNDPGLRGRVAAANRDMIAERAEYRHCVGQAAHFYRGLHELNVSPRAHG
jgi:glycosyltransferase involved in cell wall biosynthesis